MENLLILLKSSKKAFFSFIILVLLIIFSLLSFLSPYDPRSWNVVTTNLPPSFIFPLGTNSLGQDLFWITAFALRNSLFLGIMVALASRIIAIIVGFTSGYLGGKTDGVLMTITDSFIILPIFPIMIFLSFALKDRINIFTIILILSLFGWAWDARILRSLSLSLRERLFTQMAVFSGMNVPKIIYKEYLPLSIPLIMATSMNNLLWSIGMEITLAVFGFSSIETPTIGTSLQWAIEYQAMINGIWWWIAGPILVCLFLFTSLYVLSSSISQLTDPRLRLENNSNFSKSKYTDLGVAEE